MGCQGNVVLLVGSYTFSMTFTPTLTLSSVSFDVGGAYLVCLLSLVVTFYCMWHSKDCILYDMYFTSSSTNMQFSTVACVMWRWSVMWIYYCGVFTGGYIVSPPPPTLHPQQTEKSIYQGSVSIDVSQKSPEQARCVWLQQCCSEENRTHGRNSIDR